MTKPYITITKDDHHAELEVRGKNDLITIYKNSDDSVVAIATVDRANSRNDAMAMLEDWAK